MAKRKATEAWETPTGSFDTDLKIARGAALDRLGVDPKDGTARTILLVCDALDRKAADKGSAPDSLNAAFWLGWWVQDLTIGRLVKAKVWEIRSTQNRNAGKASRTAARHQRWIDRATGIHRVAPNLRVGQVAKQIADDEKRRKIADRRGKRAVEDAIRHIFHD